MTEHHGIIPTVKKPPAGLSGDLLDGYKLVAKRFLMTMLPDYQFNETIISFVHEGREFSVKGEIPLNTAKSWRVFQPKKATETLPAIPNGVEGNIKECKAVSGKTTPPDRYTEATLLGDMSAIAKYETDPRIKERLKETSGIGTPSTQASILETLFLRFFVEVTNKKEVISTPLGRSFCAAIPAQLRSPGITALWEEALESVAHGKMEDTEFMDRANAFVAKRTAEILSLRGKVKLIVPNQKSIDSGGGTQKTTDGTKSKGDTQPKSRSGSSKSKSASKKKSAAAKIVKVSAKKAKTSLG